MSAGAFQYSKYEANGGAIYRIRVQPETLALSINSNTNTAPSGDISAVGTVRTSAGNRSFGVKPRFVTIKFTGTLPDGYKEGGVIRLPWLVPSTFATLLNGQTGTYLGQAIQLVSTKAEQVR